MGRRVVHGSSDAARRQLHGVPQACATSHGSTRGGRGSRTAPQRKGIWLRNRNCAARPAMRSPEVQRETAALLELRGRAYKFQPTSPRSPRTVIATPRPRSPSPPPPESIPHGAIARKAQRQQIIAGALRRPHSAPARHRPVTPRTRWLAAADAVRGAGGGRVVAAADGADPAARRLAVRRRHHRRGGGGAAGRGRRRRGRG